MIKVYQKTLWGEINKNSLAINPGSTVECFSSKKEGIVIEIYEENINGKHAALVVDLKTGREMMPFIEECELITPHISIGHIKDFQVSDETAAKLRAYAEAR